VAREVGRNRIHVVGEHSVPHEIAAEDDARLVELYGDVARGVPLAHGQGRDGTAEVDLPAFAVGGNPGLGQDRLPRIRQQLPGGCGRQHPQVPGLRRPPGTQPVNAASVIGVVVRDDHVRRLAPGQLAHALGKPGRALLAIEALDHQDAVSTGHDASVGHRFQIRPPRAERRGDDGPDVSGDALDPREVGLRDDTLAGTGREAAANGSRRNRQAGDEPTCAAQRSGEEGPATETHTGLLAAAGSDAGL